MSPADTETTNTSLIRRSARSLRNTILGIGGAASVSSLAALDAVAKELTKAERRRRRREREREEEREEEREQRRAERRRDNDDDDDNDRMEVLRARQAALLDRSPGERRATARQSADDETTGETSGGGRTRRQQAESDDERSNDESRVLEAPQVLDDPFDTETDTGSETAEIRVGSGDTFASIDPETGTATAESNGVRAIAGPEGAFIEGSPSDTPSPASPSDDFEDDLGDGNDDGLDPSPDGGDNGGDLLS